MSKAGQISQSGSTVRCYKYTLRCSQQFCAECGECIPEKYSKSLKPVTVRLKERYLQKL